MPDSEQPRIVDSETGAESSAESADVDTAAEEAGASAPQNGVYADPSDPRVIELARAALKEITEEKTIGDLLGHRDEGEGVISLEFANLLPGYPGWRWTASIAQASPDDEPTVLEVELMPGEGALIAPDWVPWTERLAEYRAQQDALAAEAAERGELLDDDLEDEDDAEDADDDFEDEADDDLEDEDDLDDLEDLDDLHEHDLHGVADDHIDDQIDAHDLAADDRTETSDDLRDDSAVASVRVDEAEQSEGDADQAGPEEEVAPVRKQRRRKKDDESQA